MDTYDVAALIGMTVGVVTAIRTAFVFNTQWTPLVAIAVGTGLTFLWGFEQGFPYDDPQMIAEGLMTGIVLVGLGAVGTVSGFKNVSQAVRSARSDDEEAATVPASWAGPAASARLVDDFGNPVVPLDDSAPN